MRGKIKFLSLAGLVAGPNKAQDMQPYLERIVQQFAELEEPFEVWNAFLRKNVLVRIRVFIVVADNPGSREMLCQRDAGEPLS